MFSFLKNIFSVSSYSQYHNLIRFLGFKIKIQKSEIRKQLKVYLDCKKKNVDITDLPKVEGQMRDLQLANLYLLKEFDYICKQNNLTYWLDYGTLLGAVRHKGFIPWDNDIDVSMPRCDYEKVIDAIRNTSRDSNIYADFWVLEDKSIYIKILYKNCPQLFVDIFPNDTYGQVLNLEQQLLKSKEIKAKNIVLTENLKDVEDKNELYKKTLEYMQNEVLQNDKVENSDFVWGADYRHRWKNWFLSYDTLYPLKVLEFEGLEFPVVNNPDKYLSGIYGNYMNYPSKITFPHSNCPIFTQAEVEIIEKLKDLSING